MAAKRLPAVIAGVGPGTGASVARTFAKHYPVVLLARNPKNYESLVKEIEDAGGKAVGYSVDCTKEDQVKEVFEKVGSDGISSAIFNLAGGFGRKPFLDLTTAEFQSGLDANGLAGYLFAKYALPPLLQTVAAQSSTFTPKDDGTANTTLPADAHHPSLIVTGATASVKGSALFASFAAGKWALRALTQSLAKEFGPRGVHVSHVIIDGVIDIERTRGYDVGGGREDAKISPQAIADAYWFLHAQPRSTWAWELDLRPWVEKW